MNLQLRIILPIITLIAAIFGTSSYLTYHQTSSALEQAHLESMEGQARSFATAVNNLVKQAMRDVNRTARRHESIEFFHVRDHLPGTVEKTSALLAEIQRSYPEVRRISLFDRQGRIAASSEPDTIGTDFSGRGYFKDALAGRVHVTKPFLSSITNGPVIVITAPIEANGATLGVVGFTLAIDRFHLDYDATVEIGTTGHLYMLDEDGVVVAHANRDLLFGNNAADAEKYREIARMREGTRRYVDARGVEVSTLFMHEPLSQTVIALQADSEDMYSDLNRIRRTVLGISAVAVILAAAFIFMVVRPIVRSIRQCVRFADQVAAGDINSKLTIKRSDEIGQLAESLQSIPRTLRQVIAMYRAMEKAVETGDLSIQGRHDRLKGDFAELVRGTNRVLDRYRLVIENMPSPVIISAMNRSVIYLNAQARALVGEDYQGKSAGELFVREDEQDESSAVKQAISTTRPATAHTRMRANGKVLDISYTVIPLVDESGRMLALLTFLTDLTEIKNVQRTIVEVAEHSMDIASKAAAASEELAAQVEQASQGADMQRDRVSGAATAMEEMTATVLEVARSAGQASIQADEARQRAGSGAELVNRVVEAVCLVNEIAAELEKTMRDLGNQAESIGGVMNVISDIADQTNLLALNAAIEAARAGDAGRGFAVVADEVRKLAEKTMGATREVGESIKGIQSSAQATLVQVEKAASSAGEASELASRSGMALGEIVAIANSTSSLISGIATAAEEQSATTEEINHSVEEINHIAADTAEGMVQSARAVQELARLAQDLRSQLDRLRGSAA